MQRTDSEMDEEKDNVTSQEKAQGKIFINTAYRHRRGRYTTSVHGRINDKNKSKVN